VVAQHIKPGSAGRVSNAETLMRPLSGHVVLWRTERYPKVAKQPSVMLAESNERPKALSKDESVRELNDDVVFDPNHVLDVDRDEHIRCDRFDAAQDALALVGPQRVQGRERGRS